MLILPLLLLLKHLFNCFLNEIKLLFCFQINSFFKFKHLQLNNLHRMKEIEYKYILNPRNRLLSMDTSKLNNHLDLKEWLALTDPAYKINDDAYAKLLFSAFDANKDGFIDFKEYQSIVKTDVANLGRSLDEIKADFNTIDLNHDGMISLEGILFFSNFFNF